MEETRTYETEIVIPCRVSYVKVNEPYIGRNGIEKYSLTCIVDKQDTNTVDAITEAINEAFAKGLATKWNDAAPEDASMPLRDGDVDRPEDEAYKGQYYISASNSVKPDIVDRNVQDIADRSRVYSGCFCNVVLDFYPFKSDARCGIAAELGAIQLVRDGEPLTGKKPPKSRFSVID